MNGYIYWQLALNEYLMLHLIYNWLCLYVQTEKLIFLVLFDLNVCEVGEKLIFESWCVQASTLIKKNWKQNCGN